MTRLTLAAFAFSAAFSSAPAQAQSADTLLNCSACHTVTPRTPALDGPPPVPSPYPSLNGQPVRYLERQLYAYREGLRQHPQMQSTAKSLGHGDAAMARLYADALAPDLVQRRSVEGLTQARRLVEDGDWSRGLPSCSSCHAMDASDRGRLAPRLHGHPSAYLSRQLRAYANGSRQSDTLGRMRAFSAQLTPSEMTQLAEYYASWAPVALVRPQNAETEEDIQDD